MAKLTPSTEIRTKEIYSLNSVIHRDASEIINYSKTLTSPSDVFTSLDEIQAYIQECEQKRLDLKNAEVWLKTYLHATRTTLTQGNYQVKVAFKHKAGRVK